MVYHLRIRRFAPVLLLVEVALWGVIGYHSHIPDPFPTRAKRLLAA